MKQYNNGINNSNNHNSKKTALKSKIYRRFTATVALFAVLLLLLTAIAVGSPYISVVSGQLSPVQDTGGNETTATTAPSGASLGPETGGGNATTTTAGMQSACLSQNTTTTTTAASGVNASATTSTGNTTTTVAPSGASIGTNDTTTTVGTAGSMNVLAINQTAFEARTHIEQACTAIQNNNTQGALMDLNLAIKSIDNILGNLTSTTTTAGANQTSATATAGR
jgi:hypothetical protein